MKGDCNISQPAFKLLKEASHILLEIASMEEEAIKLLFESTSVFY